MPKFTVDLSGEKELISELKKLEAATRAKYLQAAIMAGAEVVRKEASARAPKRTGRLAANIITEIEGNTSADRASVKIGPSKEAFYGMFVELGTSKMSARPFLRPAIDAKKDEVEATVARELKKRLYL